MAVSPSLRDQFARDEGSDGLVIASNLQLASKEVIRNEKLQHFRLGSSFRRSVSSQPKLV